MSSMASKPLNIRWIRTGFHPYCEIFYLIVLYPVFYEYKMYIRIIKTFSLRPFIWHLGANKTSFIFYLPLSKPSKVFYINPSLFPMRAKSLSNRIRITNLIYTFI